LSLTNFDGLIPFVSSTGCEAYLSRAYAEPYACAAFGVGVVVLRDPARPEAFDDMPREFNIVIHTAYDDLYPVDSWSSEADYMRARDFLKALVGGPHGVSRGRYAGAELYEIPTRAQVDDYRKFKRELRKASPEPDYSRVLLTQTNCMSIACSTRYRCRCPTAL
jgi:hypothetical protein